MLALRITYLSREISRFSEESLFLLVGEMALETKMLMLCALGAMRYPCFWALSADRTGKYVFVYTQKHICAQTCVFKCIHILEI